MMAAIIDNQMNQTYESALGFTYAGIISLSTALMGLTISIVLHLMNKEMTLAKRTMVCGFVAVAILMLLFSQVETRISE